MAGEPEDAKLKLAQRDAHLLGAISGAAILIGGVAMGAYNPDKDTTDGHFPPPQLAMGLTMVVMGAVLACAALFKAIVGWRVFSSVFSALGEFARMAWDNGVVMVRNPRARDALVINAAAVGCFSASVGIQMLALRSGMPKFALVLSTILAIAAVVLWGASISKAIMADYENVAMFLICVEPVVLYVALLMLYKAVPFVAW